MLRLYKMIFMKSYHKATGLDYLVADLIKYYHLILMSKIDLYKCSFPSLKIPYIHTATKINTSHTGG